MTTIATVTDEETPATAALAPASDATQDGAEQLDRVGAARRSRSLVIPLPTAIIAALVTGMFGLLFLSLDGLRGDIGTLRDDMNSRIGETNERIDTLRDDMNQRINALGDEIREEMTAGFREVHAVLLDHTDRLARIETHLDIRPGADAVNP